MERETGLIDTADTDTDIKGKVKTETSAIYLLYDAVTILTSAFVLLMILFSFLFRVVGVRGASMEDTLHQGDWLITVQKEQYITGDIVVVTQPNYFNEPLIKRVIAKGGQTIDIDYELSVIYIDGKELNEPYLKEQIMEREYSNLTFPYTVEEGFLFVMGDNRNNSTDSRSPLVGPIDERYVLGRAALRLLNTGENRRLGDFSIYDYE
ncbi:MAG: signal peptidase I [Clostridiales bacterium]|nr:signal peptidase I [Clostridiales bacterium]